MIALNRTNKQGRSFRLVEVFGHEPATSIRTAGAQIIVKHSIRDIADGWHRWILGMSIEESFPFLTSQERTFLQRGAGQSLLGDF